MQCPVSQTAGPYKFFRSRCSRILGHHLSVYHPPWSHPRTSVPSTLRSSLVVGGRYKRHLGHGGVVALANHPIGSLAGLAILKVLSAVRRDVKVVANELLWAIEPLRPLLLPVNNMGNKTPKQNMKAIEQHLKDGGALLIFPAMSD